MDTSPLILALDGKKIRITHPDKLYWPDLRLSKLHMINYYQSMAAVMLPYFKDRPVTLRIFPRGVKDFSFYRRELPANAPHWMRFADYKTVTNSHRIRLPLIDDAAGLIWLANLGSIEFHLWGSTVGSLTQPDWLVFDLDPGDQAGFDQVLDAALKVRAYLQEKELKGVVKTSGGKGLHIYVPLVGGKPEDGKPDKQSSGFEKLRRWLKSATGELAGRYPELISLPKKGTHKGHTISIDYTQNSIGRNTVAPYSLRATQGAPVSMPLEWSEIEKGAIRPDDFTLFTAPQRVRKKGDVFSSLLKGRRYKL